MDPSHTSPVVTGGIGFLSPNEDFSVIKPYECRFEPNGDFPRTNTEIEIHQVEIRDVRKSKVTTRNEGFELLQLPSSLEYEQYANQSVIEQDYVPELALQMKQFFHAPHARVIDYLVSNCEHSSGSLLTAFGGSSN